MLAAVPTRRHPAATLLTLLGAAVAGLAGAHALDYLIVVPGAERHALLLRTGHGYLSRFSLVALAAAGVAAAGAASLGFRRGRGAVAEPARWGRTVLALSLLQTAGFCVLEPGERLVAGAPLGDLWGPIGAAGVLLQAVVAAAATAVLRFIHRTAEAVGRTLGAAGPPGRRAVPVRRPRGTRPARRLLAGAFRVRGPPALLPLR